MSTAHVLILGAIAGGTIFLGLPVGRMQNLAVYAFNEYKSPGVEQQAAFDRAWAAALTLIAIVMILNLIGRIVYRRFGTDITTVR